MEEEEEKVKPPLLPSLPPSFLPSFLPSHSPLLRATRSFVSVCERAPLPLPRPWALCCADHPLSTCYVWLCCLTAATCYAKGAFRYQSRSWGILAQAAFLDAHCDLSFEVTLQSFQRLGTHVTMFSLSLSLSLSHGRAHGYVNPLRRPVS